jgi:1,4-dihydroxy-2-naphthoate octaprenyltransferase
MTTHTLSMPQTALTTARAWIALQELPKHLANILPFMLGTVLAYWWGGTIDWVVFAVAGAALFFLTDGTFISNEYFDYENDRANSARIGGAEHVGVATTGGTRVLVRGLIPRRQALYVSIACFVLTVPFGVWLRYGLGTGPLTIPLGVLAIFIGWFYTAPPIRACYRGLGELFIAVGQGLVIFGAFYVQQGAAALPLLVSLPWFIALPALKIVRQFPDFEADAATDKRGLTIRFGRERMAVVYGVLIALAIASFGVIAWILPTPLLVLTALPILLLGRSMLIMLRGEWRDARRLETAAVSGFVGMLTIPLTLTAVFLLDALL